MNPLAAGMSNVVAAATGQPRVPVSAVARPPGDAEWRRPFIKEVRRERRAY